jgi:hypothetical protein
MSEIAGGLAASLRVFAKLAELVDQQDREQQQRQRRSHYAACGLADFVELTQLFDKFDDESHPEQDVIGAADPGLQEHVETMDARREILGSSGPLQNRS